MTLEQFVEQQKKVTDSIPKESYEDYVLWFCLRNGMSPEHPTELTIQPDFMSMIEYEDFCLTFVEVKRIIDSIIAPLVGKRLSLGAETAGQGISGVRTTG